MSGMHFRNSRFMKQDTENFCELREGILLTMRKEKRKQYANELRAKNFNAWGGISNEKPEKSESFQGSWENSVCATVEKNGCGDEVDEFLQEIEILYSNAPLDQKKNSLSRVVEKLKYGSPPKAGILGSIKSVLSQVLLETELVKEGLSALSQILILDFETIFHLDSLGSGKDWPVCDEMLKVLELFSWNDKQNEILVRLGLLDYLDLIFGNSKRVTHVALTILANLATGCNFVLCQIYSHKVFQKVIDGLVSNESIIRDDCSYVLRNLALFLSEDDLKNLIPLLNFENIIQALSHHGHSTHKNLLSFFLALSDYFPHSFIENSYFELFLFSKNSELHDLASEILKKIN